jgi:hypothetical protein
MCFLQNPAVSSLKFAECAKFPVGNLHKKLNNITTLLLIRIIVIPAIFPPHQKYMPPMYRLLAEVASRSPERSPWPTMVFCSWMSSLSRISGPLFDRIDIHMEVIPIPFKDLNDARPSEKSESIRARVIEARQIQENRYL